MGDFNVDLMKTESDTKTSQYFDTNLFIPHITCPARITTTTSTLIDNIFSNPINSSEGIQVT